MDIQKVRVALITAIDAMGERRGYSEAFEYKYKEQWDDDDKIVREALAELEKPDDVLGTRIDNAIMRAEIEHLNENHPEAFKEAQS